MFTTVAGYDNAQQALGVKMVKFETLARKHRQFRARIRDGFEAFLRTEGRSTTQHWHRNIHMGYVNVNSQSMWCTWVEALLCMPSLLKLGARSAEREAMLFRNFIFTYDHEMAEVAPEVGTDEDTAQRWRAWQAALEYGLTTLQSPVWVPQSTEPPIALSIARRRRRQ